MSKRKNYKEEYLWQEKLEKIVKLVILKKSMVLKEQ